MGKLSVRVSVVFLFVTFLYSSAYVLGEVIPEGWFDKAEEYWWAFPTVIVVFVSHVVTVGLTFITAAEGRWDWHT